jgi:hypothetical protein
VDEALVRQAADEYARRLLRTRPEVEEVVFFGSFAKGTYAPGSDLDVFILLARSDRPFRDRLPEFLPGPFPVGLDLFPYTREEAASPRLEPFLAEVRRSTWRHRREPGAAA